MSLAVAPILVPLFFGALSLALWRYRIAQRVLGLVGTLVLLAVAIRLFQVVHAEGMVVLHMGGWAAPLGITLAVDMLGAIMVVLTGITGLAIALFSMGDTPERHEHFGYYPLMHLLLAGVAGSFVTGDIFNLYVWFEVMLIASFALLTLGGERAQMEGAIKYVTLNLFSSAIFLSAVGILYGLLGTLNMADIAQKIDQVENTAMINVVAVMFMVAFGIKASAFPLFFWLPASYHTPLVGVSALFAGLLTKVGVYALFRMFTIVFDHDVAYTHEILVWVAGLTMLSGVLGAAAQYEFRRILSFHIVSQIGYMILGLALYTPLAIIGGVFYIMHHIIVKTTLFLVSGVTYRIAGTHELKDLGGFFRSRPMLSVLFLIPAFSLAGMPPLSGFFAKFIVIRAGVEAEAWGVTAVALLVGLLTLYSMTKIWAEVFWKAAPDTESGEPAGQGSTVGLGWMYTAIAGLAACTVFIGLNGEPIYALAETAADQLLNPDRYIRAVLEARP
ncbi:MULTISPECIES: Na+/H+ antiporter subunit D [Halomonadaceae]|uniref:Na+/H+ antiporter subunit D n=1 Tax=Vreelandella halophila TaxID=86177 RepID=A0A9X4Y9A6_9GAMM|nr:MULTISPECIES: Na+/H+ antiporter subunit D [Halomonas]MYL25351.1 Na+/H+ antiporter subunit D [Halomonas utahensis]MYL75176.1 Na+/H+ antiporter subunit D [Halomonas sp. 22501_18_FS]